MEDFEVKTTLRGKMPADAAERAEQVVRRAARFAPARVLLARVTLEMDAVPAMKRPAVAKASLDVGLRVARAYVAAPSVPQALDLLEGRLRDQLEHLAERRHARRKRGPSGGPGEWRRGDAPSPRPEHFVRPPEERELVVSKTFDVGECSLEEAVFDMELADHDFHLFRDARTGSDACLSRLDDGGVELREIERGPELDGPLAADVAVSPQATPALSVNEAIQRLDDGGERFVFFVDSGTGRGRIVYWRYDGHYGLIAPAGEAERPAADDPSDR